VSGLRTNQLEIVVAWQRFHLGQTVTGLLLPFGKKKKKCKCVKYKGCNLNYVCRTDQGNYVTAMQEGQQLQCYHHNSSLPVLFFIRLSQCSLSFFFLLLLLLSSTWSVLQKLLARRRVAIQYWQLKSFRIVYSNNLNLYWTIGVLGFDSRRGQEFFSSPPHPERLWVPPNGYRRLFLWG